MVSRPKLCMPVVGKQMVCNAAVNGAKSSKCAISTVPAPFFSKSFRGALQTTLRNSTISNKLLVSAVMKSSCCKLLSERKAGSFERVPSNSVDMAKLVKVNFVVSRSWSNTSANTAKASAAALRTISVQMATKCFLCPSSTANPTPWNWESNLTKVSMPMLFPMHMAPMRSTACSLAI